MDAPDASLQAHWSPLPSRLPQEAPQSDPLFVSDVLGRPHGFLGEPTSRRFGYPSRIQSVSRICPIFGLQPHQRIPAKRHSYLFPPGRPRSSCAHVRNISRSGLCWSPSPVPGLGAVVDAFTSETPDRMFCSCLVASVRSPGQDTTHSCFVANRCGWNGLIGGLVQQCFRLPRELWTGFVFVRRCLQLCFCLSHELLTVVDLCLHFQRGGPPLPRALVRCRSFLHNWGLRHPDFWSLRQVPGSLSPTDQLSPCATFVSLDPR